MSEKLTQSAELTQSVSKAVIDLTTELGSVAQTLTAAIATIENFSTETLGKLEDFAGSFRKTLVYFQTETKAVLQDIAQEINQGVNQSVIGMEAQRTAFAESAKNAADTFRGIREELQVALHNQAQEEQKMLQAVEARMTNILQQTHTAFQTQTDTIQIVGKEASELMTRAKENLVGSLQNIDGILQDTRQTTQEELELFRHNYQASLQEFFTHSAHNIEAQRTAFIKSAKNAADTFRGMGQELQAALHSQAEQEKQILQGTEIRMVSILKEALLQAKNYFSSIENQRMHEFRDSQI